MGLQIWVQHTILAEMAMATGQPIRESLRKMVTSLFTNSDATIGTPLVDFEHRATRR
jgi:hypothetical protein